MKMNFWIELNLNIQNKEIVHLFAMGGLWCFVICKLRPAIEQAQSRHYENFM